MSPNFGLTEYVPIITLVHALQTSLIFLNGVCVHVCVSLNTSTKWPFLEVFGL